MTPEKLKLSILKYAYTGKLCNSSYSLEEWNDYESDLYKAVWEVTAWDKRFREVDKRKQKKVISYTYVLAGEFSKLECKDGDVFLLSTGNYTGYTTEERAKGLISEGEVVTLPWGGGPTVKYYKGKFVTADNRIATALDTNTLSNEYLYYFFLSNVDYLGSVYRGTGLKHPKMSAILDMRIPLPSIDEQLNIVNRLKEIMPYIERYSVAYEKLKVANNSFPEEIRKSVFQQAIMGRLVSQNPNDEPANDLLNRIRSEKHNLVNSGKIKKDNHESIIHRKEGSFYEKRDGKDICIDTDIPFEIPDSWEWSRLSSIVSVLGDGIHGTPQYSVNGSYYFINGNNLKDGAIVINSDTKCVSEQEAEIHKRELNSNTVLTSINGTIGNIAFYNNERIILGKSACYFNLLSGISKEYIKLLLQTDYYLRYAEKVATGTTIKNVPLKGMRDLLVPIAPFNEQVRIVNKIKEFLALYERLSN